MSGMFDNIRDKASEAMANNPDKVEEVSDQVIERAGDAADKATGGKFTSQIDSAERQVDERIGE
ncbi:MAG: antitoxin [Actinomycetales bacterium]